MKEKQRKKKQNKTNEIESSFFISFLGMERSQRAYKDLIWC